MRLSKREFHAMNNPLRRALQKHVELPIMRSLGLEVEGADVLEIGCGSGYGAVLLHELGPRSYAGIDVMDEQIALARRRDLPGYEFSVMDASDLGSFEAGSRDVIVIFGILHHIPPWRRVVQECHRVLRPGGVMMLEEPDIESVRAWDRVFRWGHPAGSGFSFGELDRHLHETGFTVTARRRVPAFVFLKAVKP